MKNARRAPLEKPETSRLAIMNDLDLLWTCSEPCGFWGGDR